MLAVPTAKARVRRGLRASISRERVKGMLIEIPGNSWIDPTTVIRIAMWPAYIEPAGVPPPAIKNDAFSGMVIITSRGDLTTVVRFYTEEDAVRWSKTFAAHCNAFSLTQHDNTEWRLTLQKITDNG